MSHITLIGQVDMYRKIFAAVLFSPLLPSIVNGQIFLFITPEQKHKYIWSNLPGKTG